MLVREGTKTLTFWICSSPQSSGGLIHGILKWRGERLAREPHPWGFFGWANVGFGCFGRCLMGIFVGDRSWIGLKQMTIDTLVPPVDGTVDGKNRGTHLGCNKRTCK